MIPSNIPFDTCVERADEAVKAGFTVFQKFTCSHCGSRQTMEKPNAFHKSGICEECDSLTDIVKTGCGFAAVKSIGGKDESR